MSTPYHAGSRFFDAALGAWDAQSMPAGGRIPITPQSFDVEQRREASKIAAESGVGIRMMVHSSHTEFWMDGSVPVGEVAVYSSRQYKAWPVFDVVLSSPDDPWMPNDWRNR